jgi:transaldolase|tara:strand:+ start:675 stop:1337 length:663 start_codon:yes stop_codon:yes gene_type:complete
MFMKFFADTADIDAIAELNMFGLIDGVTTNPSLILQSGRNILEVTKEICHLVAGPVSAEVVSTGYSDMMREADVLVNIAENICIKLPLTLDGLRACKALTNDGHKTNVTLCFSATQALLAAKAGATYISPFVGRLDDINLDGITLISDIRTVFDNYPDLQTKILAASLRNLNHISEAAKIGADAATAPPDVIKALVKHPLTEAGLNQFMKDWAATGQKII